MKTFAIIKLYVVFLFFTFINIGCLAQNQNQLRINIKQEVRALQKTMPQKQNGMTFRWVAVEGNNLVMYLNVDESILDYDFDAYKKNMLENKYKFFSLVYGKNRKDVNAIVKAGMNFKMVVTGKPSNKQCTIILTPKEMRQALNIDYSAKDYLDQAILDIRKTLPLPWDNGLTLTDVYIDNNYFTYKVKTDGTVLPIRLLELSKKENDGKDMIDGFIEGFNTPEDVVTKLFVKYIKQSGMGIQYVFWSGDNSETVSFKITPYDIKSKVKMPTIY